MKKIFFINIVHTTTAETVIKDGLPLRFCATIKVQEMKCKILKREWL